MITALIAKAAVAASAIAHPAAAQPVATYQPSDVTQAKITPVATHVKPVTTLKKTVKNYHIVRPGESLSAIAQKHNVPGGWVSLYAANHKKIKNPDVIYAGQKLMLPDRALHIALPRRTDYIPRHAKPVSTPVQAPTASSNTAPSSSAGVSPSSSFEACVISRESGGNSQVMNSSGHYGLYQFSESTWEAYGGSASTFGHASAAEQKRVFDNAMASPGGASNWSPYDGC